MKLNLGCGDQVFDEWVNVDYAFGARLARLPLFRTVNRKLRFFNLDWNDKIFIHNLSKKFPWQNNSIDIVYSSHTLEHFTKKDGKNFISECHRVLRENGILRIIVPDLNYFVDSYIARRIPADDFLAELGVLYDNEEISLKRFLVPFVQFPHKCMYNTERLLEILKEAGFDAVSKAPFESEIEGIQDIEVIERTENAVIVEGRKR